jgi:hypothetical protein
MDTDGQMDVQKDVHLTICPPSVSQKEKQDCEEEKE